MEALEKELKKCDPDAVKIIAVDGVFSMEGDIANLPEIVRLSKKYNGSIMVDEAHVRDIIQMWLCRLSNDEQSFQKEIWHTAKRI